MLRDLRPGLDRDGQRQLRDPPAVRQADQARPRFGPRAPGSTTPSSSPRGRRARSTCSRPTCATLIDTVQNPSLHELLDRFFGPETESWARFREAPAAKHYHQAYAGGLLEHSLSVAQAVSAAANFFPGIDREIAVTGAILHDIGKTEAYNDDPLAIELTDAGRLEGEIPRGYYRVRREIETIEGFDPDLPRRSSTSSSPTTASSSTALRSCRPPARRRWCTRSTTSAASWAASTGSRGSSADGESWSRFDRGIDGSAFFGSRAA